MYIIILDDVPLGNAITAASHASLACYRAYSEDPVTQEWMDGTFYKVVCMVNRKEFDKACTAPDRVILTESALGGREVAAAFKPREVWPKVFRFLRLYRDAPSADVASNSGSITR